MNQSNLSKWLKAITIVVAVMGLVLIFWVVPEKSREAAERFPEFTSLFWPFLIYIWVVAIPAYLAIFQFWKVCCEIGKDNSFSMKNAKSMALISKLAIVDTILWFAGSLVFFLFDWLNAGFLVIFIFAIFASVAVAIIAAALSHLVEKASRIKEENDLTV